MTNHPTTAPAISVIMPCFNRAHGIQRVLLAYERQAGDMPFEVIAVDDGSTDDTPRLLKAHTPARYTLRVEQMPKNSGPAAARNRGLSVARAPIVAFVGDEVPRKYTEIFDIVAAARDAGINRVRQAYALNEPLQGWQVDAATREVIEKAGYGEYFCHRTGHSIGQETHGNGANMDNLETKEDRRVMRRTCFSIEPGIYLPEFGVRSEVNVFVDKDGKVYVTGGDPQTEIHRIAI